jgi:hypothetical protein
MLRRFTVRVHFPEHYKWTTHRHNDASLRRGCSDVARHTLHDLESKCQDSPNSRREYMSNCFIGELLKAVEIPGAGTS